MTKEQAVPIKRKTIRPHVEADWEEQVRKAAKATITRLRRLHWTTVRPAEGEDLAKAEQAIYEEMAKVINELTEHWY